MNAQSKALYTYILSAIDGEAYGVELNSEKDKVEFLYNCFLAEKWKFPQDRDYYKNNQRLAFASWLQGLPTPFKIAFSNSDIIAKGKEFKLLRKNASVESEDLFLPHWWLLLTGHCFNLFSKYYTSAVLTGMRISPRGFNSFIAG